MIGMRIHQAKSGFFDRQAVIEKLPPAERRALSRFGAYVRRDARRSIRPAPRQTLKTMTDTERKAYRRSVALAKYYGRPIPKRPRVQSGSKPGRPPYSQTGLLRDHIYFAFDMQAESVVIGPARLNAVAEAPHVLEYGGNIRIDGESVHIAARPYMGPAFERTFPQLPDIWKDSLR